MKRILSLVLALVLLCGLVACQGSDNTSSTTEAAGGYEGTLTELVAKLYENNTPEFMLGEPMEIVLTGEESSVNYFLGLQNGDKLKEAVFSEPMMGSQAYSLCLARLNNAADAEDVKKEIFENIDTRKWICVEADQLHVVSSGDVVMMIMMGSAMSTDMDDNLVKAFETVCGGLTGTSHSKG
ncbi:MAG: hypothetical protein IKU17_06090 [Clostridia bacterium]|nr:hypothetical protein [Clostridia bacterium]